MSFKPTVEELESRLAPVVHSFTPAAGQSPSPNAGGTPANAIVREALGGIPAPVVASAGHAQGLPFQVFPAHVPANPKA